MIAEAPRLTPQQLRGLAHPLRLRLLLALRADGPSTATLLGKRLGESSGATSYHLRQLAQYGFVEPDTRPAHGRERWWRASFPYHTLDEGEVAQDPEVSAALAAYLGELLSIQRTLLDEWLGAQTSWPSEWRDTAVTSNYFLELTLADAQALVGELQATIARHQGAPPSADAESFVVQLNAFPRKASPSEE